MAIQRELAKPLQQLAQQYPVVTITGPRQSGKTTLVRDVFSHYPYINLEDPDVRELAQHDPRAILTQHPHGLVIDEVQRVPSLLSYIQVIVDEAKQEGMFILTGSHQVELHQALSQSLAGRTALLQLLPLSLRELKTAGISKTLDELLLTGFYPRIYQKNIAPAQAYRDYIKTYLERDLRQMINVKDLLTFQRFMKLCAGRTASLFNMNSIANDIGISHHTIKHWLSILQASYLIELIPPYFENFGKRIIKSPKLYFTDVGLACHLLGIETLTHIDRDPLRGQLFENMIVMELMKTRLNQSQGPNLYYYRDSQQREVDLIYQDGPYLIPIKIKSSQTIQRSFFSGVNYFNQLVGDRCQESYLIYGGQKEFSLDNCQILNYWNSEQAVTSPTDKSQQT